MLLIAFEHTREHEDCSADAENAGYEALVITVDAPQLGRREADERNK